MTESLEIRPINVGILGCGNIFPTYAKNAGLFRKLNLKACADLNFETAGARASEFGLAALSVDELLSASDIELVVNLTVPRVHARISADILRAGKHAYSEKPLGVNLEEARELIALAEQSGLRLGCAPDTFLGAGYQTARKLIDDGWIGRPVAGTAFMLAGGPESWHPNPAFFYERGGGPLFDMGPYYIAALIHLLGPIQTVSAITSAARSERMATCKEHFGRMLKVDVPTHYSGTLIFESGAVINMAISFDVRRHQHRPIEIYGTEGSLSLPDPNTFGGAVLLSHAGNPNWSEIPYAFGYHENSRCIGVADMAHAIAAGRDHRCNAELALHILEVIAAFETSHERQTWVQIESSCTRPEVFPLGLATSLLDD